MGMGKEKATAILRYVETGDNTLLEKAGLAIAPPMYEEKDKVYGYHPESDSVIMAPSRADWDEMVSDNMDGGLLVEISKEEYDELIRLYG